MTQTLNAYILLKLLESPSSMASAVCQHQPQSFSGSIPLTQSTKAPASAVCQQQPQSYSVSISPQGIMAPTAALIIASQQGLVIASGAF